MVHMDFLAAWTAVQILIRWFCQEQADLELVLFTELEDVFSPNLQRYILGGGEE